MVAGGATPAGVEHVAAIEEHLRIGREGQGVLVALGVRPLPFGRVEVGPVDRAAGDEILERHEDAARCVFPDPRQVDGDDVEVRDGLLGVGERPQADVVERQSMEADIAAEKMGDFALKPLIDEERGIVVEEDVERFADCRARASGPTARG